jgi:glycosyltransferase involved in cell wall biosynthesis
MKRFADGIFTASKQDVPKFISKNKGYRFKIIAVRGGVDYDFFRKASKQSLKYEGVFLGRFHPQKNIDELVDIWKSVVEILPKACLIIVGEGYLENKLREKVKVEKLEDNVIIHPPAYGSEKARILKSSKLFLSSSRFDSGNIALDEALACGTPGVVYDLPGLNYPNGGVLKIKTGNKREFTKSILMLLQNRKAYSKLARQGIKYASTLDWEIKSEEALRFIKSLRR